MDERHALVTGASGDIGRAICKQLEAGGWRVRGCDLHAGPAVDAVDVRDADAVHAWVQAGPAPKLVVLNAGVVIPGRALDLSPEAWRKTLEVNLTGAFLVAQAAARQMVERGEPGHLIFVGSWAAHAADPAIPAYCASKAGLRMLMQTLALDLAGHGVQVNEVAPGYVDAGLSAQMFRTSPGLRELCAQRVPLRRLMNADDVARAVVSLAEGGPHTTGSVVLVDGGLSLGVAPDPYERRA